MYFESPDSNSLQDYKYSAETNSANTRVLAKNFGTQIVKLVLKYLLRSRDLAHMMDFLSRSTAVVLDWHDFLSGTPILVLKYSVCISFII